MPLLRDRLQLRRHPAFLRIRTSTLLGSIFPIRLPRILHCVLICHHLLVPLLDPLHFRVVNFDRATVHNFRLVCINIAADLPPLRRVKQRPRRLDRALRLLAALGDCGWLPARLHRVLARTLQVLLSLTLFVAHILLIRI